MRGRTLALVVVILAAGVTTASASRLPTKAERHEIVRVMPRISYPRSWYYLVIRVSTVVPTWAGVHIRPRPGYRGRVQVDQGSFHKSRGHWRFFEIHDSCRVPARVRADLNLPCF